MSESQGRLVVKAISRRFSDQKSMAERAVVQLQDPQLHQPLDQNTNSITVIMKHMAGNLRSRFTDFLTRDGEKPDRDRDSEFIDDIPDRASLLDQWEAGWKCLLDALAQLTDADLARTITIRSEPHSAIDALLRSLAHCAYHVGQIVQLARFLAKDHWKVLTIPRGGSKQYNRTMQARPAK